MRRKKMVIIIHLYIQHMLLLLEKNKTKSEVNVKHCIRKREE